MEQRRSLRPSYHWSEGAELRRIALPPVLPAAHPYVVYFIRNGNRVKIGTTKSLAARLNQFGLSRSQVAVVVEGDYVLEDALHVQFSEYRVDETEWFRLVPSLLAFIKHCKGGVAEAVLGDPEHQALWEDLDQIAARTGRPLGDLRKLRKDPTWPRSVGTTGGRRRLYHRRQVDSWLAQSSP
ncbi:GIY-YIG nuclease family protein [Streptomyces sp. NPDC006700]|uniref:GIY-YIG nuclease family protein n=1 Tax=Streptomyces sp. NPDC006700 TaxID=3154479 RepID=UPI0033D25CAF